MKVHFAWLVGVLFALGCGSTPREVDLGVDPGTGISIEDAKADSLYPVESLALGESLTLSVPEPYERDDERGDTTILQTPRYVELQLEAGDEIRIVSRRIRGAIEPAAYLFHDRRFVPPTSYVYEWGQGVSEEEFPYADEDFGRISRSREALIIDYRIAESGRYLIESRDSLWLASGDLELSAECTGGRCAGNTDHADSTCILAAFHSLREGHEGAVAEAFQAELERLRVDESERSCASACDGEHAEICEQVVNELTFANEQGERCVAELDECIATCVLVNDGTPSSSDEGRGVAEVCFSSDNTRCAAWAAQHSSCGGEERIAGSSRACETRCDATVGAWHSGIATESCYESCEATLAQDNAELESYASGGAFEAFDASDHPAVFSSREIPNAILRVAAEWATEQAGDSDDHEYLVEEDAWIVERAENPGRSIGYFVFVSMTGPEVEEGAGHFLTINGDGVVLTATRRSDP